MLQKVTAWFDSWPRWAEIMVGLLALLLAAWGVVATLGGEDDAAVEASGPSTTRATLPATTQTVASTATSLNSAEFEFDPRAFQSPQEIREGESHVFFDSDGSGLIVQVSTIDDDLLVVGSVTAFLAGDEVCPWLDVGAASGPLTYRGGGTEYVITVDVPFSFLAEVRVAKRVSGEPSGTDPCEPPTD